MRAYSRMITQRIAATPHEHVERRAGRGGRELPVRCPVKSNAPCGWWMNMPQPSVPTSHWIGARAPCVWS